MSGMNDGVSKYWIVESRGGLNLDGALDEMDLVGMAIRRALSADEQALKKISELMSEIEAEFSSDDAEP
jgi:hypothetical protein